MSTSEWRVLQRGKQKCDTLFFFNYRIRCPLPYSDEMEVQEATPVQPAAVDDDIVLLEDDVEVIDLDDETPSLTKVFAKLCKVHFQVTPEIRRLITK